MTPLACVYWLLDANDKPLYVGVTDDLRRRLSQHAATKLWWQHVASVAHTDDMPRRDALDIETDALRHDRVQHTREHDEAYAALIASEVEAVRDAMTDEQADKVRAVLAPHVKRATRSSGRGASPRAAAGSRPGRAGAPPVASALPGRSSA